MPRNEREKNGGGKMSKRKSGRMDSTRMLTEGGRKGKRVLGMEE